MADAAFDPGRRLWIGIPGPEVDAATRALLEEVRPGGIVLFRRNVRSKEQVVGLTAALRELLGDGLVIAADQEGGLVARFLGEATVFPGNMALGAIARADRARALALAEEVGRITAAEMRSLGCTVNLAPDLDLAIRGRNPGVGIRSFGADPELAGALGAAMVKGHLAAGVTPTLKHWPGLGGATTDPHVDLPRVHDHEAGLHQRPFDLAAAAGPVVVMTTHCVCASLDPERPVTLSPRAVAGVLREKAGPDAVLMTDDLEMGAMTRRFGEDEVVRGASAAGHDVLTLCHDQDRIRRTRALLERGLARGEGCFGDPAAIAARLDGLAGRRGPRAPEVDPARGAALAEEIAAAAITIVRDDTGLLPVLPRHRAVLALPAFGGETGVEDPLRGEADALELARALEDRVRLVKLPLAPSAEDVEALLADARRSERLLVVLTNARFLEAQAALARRAVLEHSGTILLPIRNPFDLEVVPANVIFTALACYGFRAPQLRGLAAVLKGERRAEGRLPVTLLPPP